MLKQDFLEKLQFSFQWIQNFLEEDYLRDPHHKFNQYFTTFNDLSISQVDRLLASYSLTYSWPYLFLSDKQKSWWTS